MLNKICFYIFASLIVMSFADVFANPPETKEDKHTHTEKYSQFHDEINGHSQLSPEEIDGQAEAEDQEIARYTDNDKWSQFDDEITWAFSDPELYQDS